MRKVCVVILLSLAGCKEPPGGKDSGALPTPTVGGVQREIVLSLEDMQAYLAVKRKAVNRLEEALVRWEREGGDLLLELREMATLENEAAKALGYDPVRFSQVRDTIASLLASKSYAEDMLRVERELARSREELVRQREQTRDQATREFLQAQILALERELMRLAKERGRFSSKRTNLELLDKFRVEMAQLQARQDRATRRIRELWSAGMYRQGMQPSGRP